MFVLNVDTAAMAGLAKNLQCLNRSAYPVAVRGTLNDAAFDMKRNTLPASAKKNFITRAPSFFKAFSGVEKATGFDVNRMQATVGMTDMGKQTARTAVDHMEQQERGGRISGGLDYLKGARGGSNQRRVSRANYQKRSNQIGGAYKRNLRSAKAKFVASAFVAKSTGKLMRINTGKGSFLAKVTAIKKLKDGGVKVHSRLIAEERRSVTIKATRFVSEAAGATARKMDIFFYQQAERQFTRAMR